MSIVLKNQNIGSLGIEWDNDKVSLLKETFFKGSNNQEFELFLHACQRTGLDPFMRQIHPVKRFDSRLGKEVMTIQTGIDGYRLIAERTGKYVPGREPSFSYDQEGNLVSATAYVKKLAADGTWHEIPATAFYKEYVQTKKDGNPTAFWEKMAHNQLAKCAEALALRKAFPADLSGVYTQEEMAQASKDEVITGNTILPEKKFNPDELKEYVKNKSDQLETDPEIFIQFMDYIKDPKGWTYEKCIEAFEKDFSYTAREFQKWLDKNLINQSA